MSKLEISCSADGLARIHLNHAETKNRVDLEFCKDLRTALKALGREECVRVLLITGRSDVFCSGASRELLERLVRGELAVRDFADPFQFLEFPLPILAALEGSAVGGGLALAMSCDLRVAAEEGRYGFNFADLGFTPEMGVTALLPALVGPAFALEMLATGKLYKGRELRERGIFNHVVPASKVLEVALEMAVRIAEKPRHVLALLKETWARQRCPALQEAVEWEHRMHQRCFARAEAKELLAENYVHAVR